MNLKPFGKDHGKQGQQELQSFGALLNIKKKN